MNLQARRALIATLILLGAGMSTLTSATFGNNTTVTPHVFDAAVDSATADVDVKYNTADGSYVQCARDGTDIYFSRTSNHGSSYSPARTLVGAGNWCSIVRMTATSYTIVAGTAVYVSNDSGATFGSVSTAPSLPYSGATVGGCAADSGGSYIGVVLIGTGTGAGSYFIIAGTGTWQTPYFFISNNISPHCGIAIRQDDNVKIGVVLGDGNRFYRSVNLGGTWSDYDLANNFNGFTGGANVEIGAFDYSVSDGVTIHDPYLIGGHEVRDAGNGGGRQIRMIAVPSDSATQAPVRYQPFAFGSYGATSAGFVKIDQIGTQATVIAWEKASTGTIEAIVLYTSGFLPRLGTPVTVTSPTAEFFDLTLVNENDVVLQKGNTDYFIVSNDAGVTPTPTPTPGPGTPTPTPTPTPPPPIIDFTPTAASWTTQVVSGLNGEDTDYLSPAGETSGTIGFAFHRVTSNDVGFATGTFAGGFTVKTLDIAPGDATILSPQLVKVTDSTWVIVAKTSATVLKMYRSVNSGTTWTEEDTRTSTFSGFPFEIDNNGADIFLAWYTTASNLRFEKSLDGGDSWGVIHDAGAIPAIGDILDVSGTTLSHERAAGTSTSPGTPTESSSDDGGGFWSSYATIGGTTSTSYDTGIESIKGGSSIRSFTYLKCTISCGVTPVYGFKYAYSSNAATWTLQDLTANVASGGDFHAHSNNYLARNSGGKTLLVAQGQGPPEVWFANDWTTALTQVTPASFPDADGTASAVMQTSRAYVVLSNASFGGRLEVWSSPLTGFGPTPTPTPTGTPTPTPTPIPAVQTTAATGLVGFDITKFGEYAIARTNSGDFVRTYNGDTLGAIASQDTNCALIHGVTAIGSDGFAYWTCAGGTATHVHMADRFLNDYPMDCVGSCPSSNVDITSLANEGQYLDMAMPYGAMVQSIGDNGNERIHGFNFMVTGANGNAYNLAIGLNEYNGNGLFQNDVQSKSEAFQSYAATIPQGICTNNNAAAPTAYFTEPVTATEGFQVAESRNVGTHPPEYTSTPTLTYHGAPAINQAKDIACMKTAPYNRLIVALANNNVVAYDLNTGTALWTVAVPNLQYVSLSGDGKWASWTTTTQTQLVNAITGATLCPPLANPTGTEKDAELDYFGQKQFVATDVNIALFDVHACTTGITIPPGGNPTPTPTPVNNPGGGNQTGVIPTAPAGLAVRVTRAWTNDGGTNTGQSALLDLHWRLSSNDPNRTVGAYDYHMYAQGNFVGTDQITSLDGEGIRYHQLETSVGARYYVLIQAQNHTSGARSVFSCVVSVDTRVAGDFQQCGQSTAVIQGGGATGNQTDIGNGLTNFCAELFGPSDASLFFCGLVFLAIIVISALVGLRSQGVSGTALLIPPLALGLGWMLFATFAGIWPLIALIIMIVLTAAVVVAALRTGIFGRGASA